MTDVLGGPQLPGSVETKITARASAALPAAGAYDTAPTEFRMSSLRYLNLFILYTRGAAGGAYDFLIEVSPDASGSAWYTVVLKTEATVVINTDAQSNVQREAIEYGAVGASAEGIMFGPLDLGRAVERVRIPFRETGVAGTPGTLAAVAMLTSIT